MSQKHGSNLIFHGALVFLVGMAAGFPYAFAVLESLAEDAALGAAGAVRGWRMAHLEGILNGVLLIAVGGAGRTIKLSARLERVLVYGLIITAWGNMIASVVGPIYGVRGLEPGQSGPNMLMYTLFMVAVLTVVVSLSLVARGAWAARGEKGD